MEMEEKIDTDGEGEKSEQVNTDENLTEAIEEPKLEEEDKDLIEEARQEGKSEEVDETVEEKVASEEQLEEKEEEESPTSSPEPEKEEEEQETSDKRKSSVSESPEKLSSVSVSASTSSSKKEEEERDNVEVQMQERFLAVRQLLRMARGKHAFLRKQLIEHFKSRKMEYALEDPREARKPNARLLDEYNKKMDAFHLVTKQITIERHDMEQRLESLEQEHAEKLEELSVLTNAWLQRQREVGSGLIYAKTGKPLLDKHVNDSIKQQRLHLDLMKELRNKLIKLEVKIADVENDLKKMEIDENVHLIQYEELKMENIGFLEKIEERNEEIDRLRRRCEGAIQTLSHVKEKSSGHDTDIVYLTKKLEELDEVFTTEREKLNDLKRKRDYYRNASNKLYADSGLLMQPKLLRDMEAATNEHQAKMEQLDRLKEENETTAKQIRAIRKNIEQCVIELQEKSGTKSRTSLF